MLQSKLKILFLLFLSPTIIFGQQLRSSQTHQHTDTNIVRQLNNGIEGNGDGNATVCPEVSQKEERSGLRQYLPTDLMSLVDFSLNVTMDIAKDPGLYHRVPWYRKTYERFFVWHDFNDAHILLKHDDKCWATFGGQKLFNLLDRLQQLVPLPMKARNSTCWVRGGYFNAYYTSYLEDFKSKTKGCVESCADSPCPLILTGDLQAGGVAIVASTDLKEFNPIVITFSAPKVLYETGPFYAKNKGKCTDVNPYNHFRFTSLTLGNRPAYDRLAYDYSFGAQHIGNQIIVDSNRNAVNVGLYGSDTRSPIGQNFQTINRHVKNWKSLMDICRPVPVAGWPNGHFCSKHDECQSNFCLQKQCSSTHVMLLNAGQRCNDDLECISGKCERWNYVGFKVCERWTMERSAFGESNSLEKSAFGE